VICFGFTSYWFSKFFWSFQKCTNAKLKQRRITSLVVFVFFIFCLIKTLKFSYKILIFNSFNLIYGLISGVTYFNKKPSKTRSVSSIHGTVVLYLFEFSSINAPNTTGGVMLASTDDIFTETNTTFISL
jgi:hypothetical protein